MLEKSSLKMAAGFILQLSYTELFKKKNYDKEISWFENDTKNTKRDVNKPFVALECQKHLL